MSGFRKLLLLLLISGLLVWKAEAKCPKGCYCVRKDVRCMKAHLTTVPDVPNNTYTLDLRGNEIKTIASGSLQFRHLHSLLLNNNLLVAIESDSFNGLRELKFLYLYKNYIKFIASDAFRGLKKLEQLYLHANEIENLQPEVFADLSNLERLFLHSNRLKHLPGGLLSGTPKILRFRLDNNPLVCDCKLLWLMLMISKRSAEGKRLEVSGLCHEPSKFKGIAINQLPYDDLHCDEPVILEEPLDIITEEGGKAIFTCKVFGNPTPRVVWMKNSNEIPEDDSNFHIMENGSLIVENPEVDDDGTFECMAKSVMGEAKSRPARMALKKKVSYGYPVFSMVPHDIVARMGTELIELNCLAKAKPRPRVHWLHNNERLILNDRVQVFHNGTLAIKSAIDSDGGLYTCYAENQHGRISASAKVEIRSPPRFVERSPEKTAQVGDRVEFVCLAEGIPKPTITWYKNSQPFTYPTGLPGSDSNDKFIIESVQLTDQGIYVCTAENAEGFIEATTSLTVVSDIAEAPILKIKPYDIEAALGSSVEIPCRSENSPYPTIIWHKDGRALNPSERIKISTFGSIYIINITQRDMGRYECSAINQYGRDTASGLLTIKDAVLPGDVFVTQALADAIEEINIAMNNTLERLFDTNRTEKLSTADLFKKIRYPNAAAREVAKAAEIYERTLVNIRKLVNQGVKIKATDTFDYKEILTPEHLELVARLSGCTEHKRIADCSDKCYHSKFRNIDGSCNNFKSPTWGASLTGFRRILPPIYENGFSQPVGWDKTIKYNGYNLPSARLVSSKLISTQNITPDREITHMVMQWGQFIDHDLDHSLPSVSSQSWDGIDCKKSCDYAAPCFPIEIPSNDTRVRNRRCLDFVRTSAVCGSGMTSVFFGEVQPREQVNQLTSYLDASQVYGYSEEIANSLRDLTPNNGLLRIGLTYPGAKPLLPFAGNQGIDCRRNLSESSVNCFAAGDIRVNEQVGLTAMHTLWMREHNRIAAELKKLNPQWDGDKIFNEARKIVGAMMQHITFKEWLPIILGKQGMRTLGNFSQYDPELNAAISNVFATAAFRFGHSLINPVLERLDENFEVIRHGNLALHKAFFSPWRITDEGGIDPLIRGMFMAAAKLKKPTENLNNELTEKLFRPAHAVALDLAAINIQRSRDHAIPPYLKWRQYCNMATVSSFDDLQYEITNAEVRSLLRELYNSPENIDVWVGGILEDQIPGSKVGPLFQCLLIEQFRRTRDGDRLYYENPGVFKPEQLKEIYKTSLARVICDNGDNIDTITENVFLLPELQEGVIACSTLPTIDLNQWQDCSECYSKDTAKLAKRLEDAEKEMKEFTILMIEMKDKLKILEERTRDEF